MFVLSKQNGLTFSFHVLFIFKPNEFCKEYSTNFISRFLNVVLRHCCMKLLALRNLLEKPTRETITCASRFGLKSVGPDGAVELVCQIFLSMQTR